MKFAYLERIIRQPMISTSFVEHDEIVVNKRLKQSESRISKVSCLALLVLFDRA